MKHYGDITKLNGSELPVVDCITFGAPCQDLSVAGKRAGMKHEDMGDDETTRSGLFFDAVRIIKEMRESDRSNGRADELVRPRFAVYENVPGAFSSNEGRDWQAVVTELVRVADPAAPDVPLPEKGKWPHAGSIYGVGANGVPFSVAWRLHDAQWWGVPQRRKRVCVLCDYGGYSAGEILFDPQYRRETDGAEANTPFRDTGGDAGQQVHSVKTGLRGNPEQSGEAWQGTAEGTEGCP